MAARGHGDEPSSSSGEEDGDAKWREAIHSVAASSTFTSSFVNGVSTTDKQVSKSHGDSDVDHNDDDGYYRPKTQQPKPYQIKILTDFPQAQKLLDKMLESTLEIVEVPNQPVDHEPQNAEVGVRLFKRAPPGIVFDHIDELQRPKKRPRILPGKDIDEKSKKFQKRIHAVAVNGEDIMSKAKMAYQKLLARLETKDAAAKAATKREEERVENLKRIRGERWLPSVAKEMKARSRG